MLQTNTESAINPPSATRPCGHKRNRKGIAGQSLVEILVALFIVSIGILPMLSLMLDANRVATQTHLHAAAYAAARQEIESLHAMSFDGRTNGSLVPVAGTFEIPDAIADQYPAAKMKGDYVVAPLSTTLQQVTVEVSWQNPAAKYQQTTSVRLDTMIAKEPGL